MARQANRLLHSNPVSAYHCPSATAEFDQQIAEPSSQQSSHLFVGVDCDDDGAGHPVVAHHGPRVDSEGLNLVTLTYRVRTCYAT